VETAADGEVVWSWRPGAGVKLAAMLTHCAGDGDKKPVTRESPKETVKTIAQGRPGVSGEPVVTNLRVYYFYTQGCGCA
jgi:hypothetical protein